MLDMNHVIHHIETPPRLLAGVGRGRFSIDTPPRLTPPRLLAGDWAEGKVLYVDSMNHVIHNIETINPENPPLPTPC